MKQSKINSYFSPGRMKAGTSGSAIRSSYHRPNNPHRATANDIFFNSKDPTVIYEKIREKERQHMKFATGDHIGLESDLSSQNSSQMILNSQFNSQNSQTFIGSSSVSEDATNWYQTWMNKHQPPGLHRPQSRSSSRQSYSSSSQDFKQYMEEARKRSKEKEERDMLSNLLGLVKEMCEEAKSAVSVNNGNCNVQLSEGFNSTFDKVGDLAKQLAGIENLFTSKKEYEDKIKELERQLQICRSENTGLRKQLEEARSDEDNRIMEKLTETFDKGQKIQSEKFEELVTNTSEIRSILKKPKLTTADMWSQYSPRLSPPTPAKKLARSVSTETSPPYWASLKNSNHWSICESADFQVRCPVGRFPHPRCDFPASSTCTIPPHSFAAPLSLPPRYCETELQKKRSAGCLQYSGQPRSMSPDSAGRTLSIMPSQVGVVHGQPGNIFASPSIHPVRYPWNANKNSPVATVKPRQRLAGGDDGNERSANSDRESLPGNSAQNWQELAKSQSDAWFSRPTTRSRRNMVSTEPLAGKSETDVGKMTESSVVNSSDTNEATARTKSRRRKKTQFNRKKGRGLKRPPASSEEDLVTSVAENDTISAKPSLCESQVDNPVPVAENMSRSGNIEDGPRPITLRKVKQEPPCSMTNPYPIPTCYRSEPASTSWILFSDSEDESSGHDAVLFEDGSGRIQQIV